jgi:lipoprotein-anchoring transpeptidase ErfK/SrfK
VLNKGRHVQRRFFGRTWLVVLLVIAGVLLLAGGGSAFAAYRYDQATEHKLLPGTEISGVDVGGMTRKEAIAAVRTQVDDSLTASLTISSAGEHWQVTPQELGVEANVSRSVTQAMRQTESLPWWQRVYHRIADKPVHSSTPVRYDYDQSKVDEFVHQIASKVEEQPQSASLALVDGKVVRQKPKPGQQLKAPFGAQRLLNALEHQQTSVTLPVKKVQPDSNDAGVTVVVRLSENRLYLYDGFDLEKTYPVATAMPGFTTPVGTWQIVNKVENPTWVNPAPTGWGAGEPATIPPGPGNPLGTRWMGLDAAGVGMHGTPDAASIGYSASHGCIRMRIPDAEWLFGHVRIGTPVFIVSA